MRKGSVEDRSARLGVKKERTKACASGGGCEDGPQRGRPTVETPKKGVPGRLENWLRRDREAMRRWCWGHMRSSDGRPVIDPDAARELIECWTIWQVKDEGNLAPEEVRLLLDLLGSWMTSGDSKAKWQRRLRRRREALKGRGEVDSNQ